MRFARAALAAVVLASSSPLLAAPCGGFTDVDDANPAHAPFCDSVEWMKLRNITLGCTATLYCPDTLVTRLQMAAFMFRLGFQNAFLQGGNEFGATAVLGTTDNHAVDVRANGARVMRYEPNAISPNVIGGSPANNVTAGVRGATIGGGGVPSGDSDPDFTSEGPNRVTDVFGTVGGGYGVIAGNNAGSTLDAPFATVGGGAQQPGGRRGQHHCRGLRQPGERPLQHHCWRCRPSGAQRCKYGWRRTEQHGEWHGVDGRRG